MCFCVFLKVQIPYVEDLMPIEASAIYFPGAAEMCFPPATWPGVPLRSRCPHSLVPALDWKMCSVCIESSVRIINIPVQVY